MENHLKITHDRLVLVAGPVKVTVSRSGVTISGHPGPVLEQVKRAWAAQVAATSYKDRLIQIGLLYGPLKVSGETSTMDPRTLKWTRSVRVVEPASC